MITINYQAYGHDFKLRLRLYQDGETRFINVNKLLQGNLLKRHWNQKKQRFVPSAPFSKENNEILVQFKHKYDQKAVDWNGTLSNFIASVDGTSIAEAVVKPTMHDLFQRVIKELKTHKHPDGTTKGTYENYDKVEKRMMEFCAYKKINYSTLFVENVTKDFVNNIFKWIKDKRQNKGYMYMSKTIHAILVKAETYGWYDFEQVKGVEWAKKTRVSEQKYYTLTSEQCNKLMTMSPKCLPQCKHKLFYKDFCIFLLFTGLSPCDAVALKYSDIKRIDGVDHFVFRRRKISEKQSVPCCVPINDKMREIMKKWKSVSKDGYVFPVRNKAKIQSQKTDNGDIKHLVNRLNGWLKRLGAVLNCNFPLHNYTFRHTAITNYISRGVPITYVANMMGTSVENIEKIYYNNQGDSESRNKVLSIGSF